jgi:hypothetical protein
MSKRPLATLASLAFVVAAASQLGATDCGGQILRDPGFDLWCGDALCTWRVDRGDARRAPTWHEGDSGVELLGDDAAISQLAPVNSYDTTCIEFSGLAYVEDTAEVHFTADVLGDGKIELDERIPTSTFTPIKFTFGIKPPYDGVRFAFSKRGAGKVVLAELAAKVAHTCVSQLDPGPRPLGASCDQPSDCVSNRCAISTGGHTLLGGTCTGCDPTLGDAACDAGHVCGLGKALVPTMTVPLQCVPRGNRVLGERCVSDPECATGTCLGNYCSACHDGNCTAPQVCLTSTWAVNDLGTPSPAPAVCQLAAAGEPCAAHTDCASGACLGTPRRECLDHRPCDSAADCPVPGNTLVPGHCLELGVQGGRCR